MPTKCPTDLCGVYISFINTTHQWPLLHTSTVQSPLLVITPLSVSRLAAMPKRAGSTASIITVAMVSSSFVKRRESLSLSLHLVGWIQLSSVKQLLRVRSTQSTKCYNGWAQSQVSHSSSHDITRATYNLRTHICRAVYNVRAQHIHITHITMNNYIDDAALYAAILEDDAVYNSLPRLNLPVRDGRRRQRRRKQAQQNARFNQFHNWPLNHPRCVKRSIL